MNLSRRSFLGIAAGLAAAPPRFLQEKAPLIDTHMHVWSDDPKRYPFRHPFDPDSAPPRIAATVDLVVKEMDESGVSHCVLVQAIFHGWDNQYLADCLKAHPRRFRGQGLIDPTDAKAAGTLDFWIREKGLAGMRFSPIYSKGKEGWLDAPEGNPLWKKAGELRAIFNFFIETGQLPRLDTMMERFPEVRVVIDHLARIDLKAADPLPEMKKLLALARHKNVWVKVSELSLLSPSGKYPYADTFPWVRRVYDAFGPDRLLWGTGFPGPTRAQAGRPSLAEELGLIEREIPFFSGGDRRKILGGNAAALWGF